MAYLKKDDMEAIRKEHVLEQNKRYHSAMEAIVKDALTQIDLDSIRDDLLKQIKARPEESSVSAFYSLMLHKLFGSAYSWKATKDGKGEFVKNPSPPYELWLESPSGHMKRIILDRNKWAGETLIRDMFHDYFYNADPHIQQLKAVFKDAFPEAIVHLFLYNNTNEDAFLRFEICMKLEPKIEGIETYESKMKSYF